MLLLLLLLKLALINSKVYVCLFLHSPAVSLCCCLATASLRPWHICITVSCVFCILSLVTVCFRLPQNMLGDARPIHDSVPAATHCLIWFVLQQGSCFLFFIPGCVLHIYHHLFAEGLQDSRTPAAPISDTDIIAGPMPSSALMVAVAPHQSQLELMMNEGHVQHPPSD